MGKAVTKRVDFAKQCEGKIKHVDRDRARQARRATRGGRSHLAIYRCPWCDYFHLGTAWADPYLFDVEARAEAREELDVDEAAARAAAVVLGVPLDQARRLLEPAEEVTDG